MGSKGYNNFMSKKAFHPGSYANQKRIQEAEAREQAKRKHDEETLAQYQKEQELFQQRMLVSKESKDKLSLSFMYDAPPGTSQKDKDNKEGDTTQLDLKWKSEKSSNSKLPKTSKRKCDSDSDDDEPVLLTWKREEPKAKKKLPQDQSKDKTPPPPTPLVKQEIKSEDKSTTVPKLVKKER